MDNELKVTRKTHRKLELSSEKPIKSWGDADVLKMMGLGEVYAKEDLKLLGDDFVLMP